MNENEKFAERIDWNLPALKEAAMLHAQGKDEEAFHQVIGHFRSRKNPVYLFTAEEAGACDDPLVMKEAKDTMEHVFYGHAFGKEIHWMENPTEPTSHDDEFSWSIYRTIFWQPLVRAYAKTKDPSYVREFVQQMRSFVSFWPVEPFMKDDVYAQSFTFPGHAWRTIETGIRIYTTWLPCFEVFRACPAFDDESFMIFLNAMYDHAEFLSSHYSNHKSSSNWLSMEVTALLQIGIMFPEFKQSKIWYNLAYRRMAHEVLYDFDEEGIHMERTPVYHMVAAISFLQAYLLLQANNLPTPPYMFPLLEKSAVYVMRLVKPDLSTPMIGDADREDLTTSRADSSAYEGMNLSFFPDDLNELRAYFRLMARLTGRKDFLWFASQRKEGCPPAELDSNLREGIYVMRSGFDPKDSYLLVHGVSLERGEKSTHSHVDQGHVEAQIQGEDVLIDCGRFIYNRSVWKDWRKYFTFQGAHNTLDVDGHEMGVTPGQTERMRGVRTFCHAFEKRKEYWLIDVSHNGYAYLDDPVFFRRKVLRLPDESLVIFDRITGLGQADHQFRENFNFAPGVMETDGKAFAYTTKQGTRFSCSFFSDAPISTTVLRGSEEPKGGWVSYGYSKKEPIPEVVLSCQGKAPLCFCTIIRKGKADMKATIKDGCLSAQLGNYRLEVSDSVVSVKEG